MWWSLVFSTFGGGVMKVNIKILLMNYNNIARISDKIVATNKANMFKASNIKGTFNAIDALAILNLPTKQEVDCNIYWA